jgi:fatty acid desaturase
VSIVGAAHQLKRESETTDHAAARGLELRPGSLYRRFATELEPRPEIYWLDLLSSVFVGWTAFAWATVLAPWSVPKIIHELAHIKPGSLPGFELAWNLLVGLPMLVPSLMYVGPHTDHHRRRIFGTHLDPEYEPIAHWSPLKILRSGIAMFLVPPMLLLRWGVLGPISWLVPPFRRFLIGSLSTLLINGRYKRRMPTGSERDRWMLGEIGGAVVAWALMYSAWAGILSVSVFVQYYCLSAAVLMVNYARTLAAHRYDNSDVELDDLGQLLDSINLYGNSWLTALSAPVGLRYHALHHFMPALPYHSLGAVNRALLYELPAESPYRLTQVSGMIVALKDLFAVAGSSRHQLAPPESDQVSEAAAGAHGLDR